MNNKPICKAAAVLLAAVMALGGCAAPAVADVSTSSQQSPLVLLRRGIYSEQDLDSSYNESQSTKITLSDSKTEISGSGASAKEGTITITEGGCYILSGKLSDGRIIVSADKEDTVRLVLNGADISCSDNAPIFIEQCKKAIVTLAPNSKNYLSDSESYTFSNGDDEPSATLFSKADLTINGEGALSVTANYNNAIATKDSLIIAGGNITASAKNDAVRGKDSVTILDGSFDLTAGGDAIKSNNDKEFALGYIVIDGGNFKINAENDAIQAESTLVITNGSFEITTGGGSENVQTKQQRPGDMGGGRMPPEGFEKRGNQPPRDMGMAPPPESFDVQNTDEQTTESMKGLKAGAVIEVVGGSFLLDCADDAIHSNGSADISGGSFNIKTGDDGIHADSLLEISGGKIVIEKGYEGIEGDSITISGGNIDITSEDDGVNVSGGADGMFGSRFAADSFSDSSDEHLLFISGGQINVCASGDGMDSNGSIKVTGGFITVSGPENSGNGSLDYNNSCTVSGGTLIAAGSSGMAQYPDGALGQPVLNIYFAERQQAGSAVSINSSSGVILSFAPQSSFDFITICSPELKTSEIYSVSLGSDKLCEVTLSDTVTSISSDGSAASPMGMRGDKAGRKGGAGRIIQPQS